AMTDWEKMAADYAVLGMSPKEHPMRFLRPGLPRGVRSSREVADAPDGIRVTTAGLVACRQRPGTAQGFLFVTLEDEFGLTNVIVRPDLYAKARVILRSEPFLIMTGKLQRKEGVVNVLAEAVSVVPKPVALVAPMAHSFR
ncbi:MAG: error-prone DNA polymerase, partial [Chloroflexi bacterium]|nr:error-prone DNA polymerase [Chloroflexota bacterium]